MESNSGPSMMRTAVVNVTVAGRQLTMELGVPMRPMRVVELLPLLRQVADALTSVAVEGMVKSGRTISCKAGCGACCRQPVPVALAEARDLVEMVEGMEEPRRSEIRRRFAEAKRRMEEGGLLEKLRNPDGVPAEEKQALAIAYLKLGIDCPFLENEACTIYERRPITCREYMVVSPAENCGKMGAATVERVRLPAGSMSPRVSRLDQPATDEDAKWVALVLAPEYVAANPQEPAMRAGTELVGEFFAQIQRGNGGK